MKLLVFAHTPPPHHGQSSMVQLLIEGFGGDQRKTQEAKSGAAISGIECYHVNCRYSETLEDIGSFRIGKMWLVLRYCFEAIWCRFRYGVRTFYYVPAPGKRAALYRDWVVMLLCRPFFREIIHHWHAVGLGDWLRKEGNRWERGLTHRLLRRPALGIVLAIPSMRDALWFRSRDVQIVPDGIPDPCPDFAAAILPRRQARLASRIRLLAGTDRTAKEDATTFEVLYLAHCTREKGLFDTLDAVALANAQLRERSSPLRCRLTIAGLFPREDEEAEFCKRIAQPDLVGSVDYIGFADGERKSALLGASDCLCFPTYYHAESFGLVVAEAMAAGLAVVTTRWRALPEMLPADHSGFVPVRDPAATAGALIAAFTHDGTGLRSVFTAQFTGAAHLAKLAGALRSLSAA